ncbi:hypothetical protein AB0L88_37255, partial [Saccharopolyspora shandongensis]|uniref:hypothetical protein n=1 Tax=Saccharopolyspora shandongensis TaxID=418495 RepID=UPI0034483983
MIQQLLQPSLFGSHPGEIGMSNPRHHPTASTTPGRFPRLHTRRLGKNHTPLIINRVQEVISETIL